MFLSCDNGHRCQQAAGSGREAIEIISGCFAEYQRKCETLHQDIVCTIGFCCIALRYLTKAFIFRK